MKAANSANSVGPVPDSSIVLLPQKAQNCIRITDVIAVAPVQLSNCELIRTFLQ